LRLRRPSLLRCSPLQSSVPAEAVKVQAVAEVHELMVRAVPAMVMVPDQLVEKTVPDTQVTEVVLVLTVPTPPPRRMFRRSPRRLRFAKW